MVGTYVIEDIFLLNRKFRVDHYPELLTLTLTVMQHPHNDSDWFFFLILKGSHWKLGENMCFERGWSKAGESVVEE